MDRVPDRIPEKTPHEWYSTGNGYDPADYCRHCGANSYQSFGTEFCEDYHEAVRINKEKVEYRHAPTEAAWNRARQVLTAEEWTLMVLDRHTARFPCARPYRIKDIIVV